MFGWLGDLAGDIRSGDYLIVVAILLLVSNLVWRVYFRWLSRDGEPVHPRLFGLAFQLGLTLFLERVYEYTRAHIAITDLGMKAYSNGWGILDFELKRGILFEPRLERFFLHDIVFMHFIYYFYGAAHLLVTVSFLIWLYLRRNESFAFVRNLFYLCTGIALVIYVNFPTAPPRLYSPWGFQDPAQILGFTGPGSQTQASSYLYNPYAAMPSLHMTYAIIVGATMVVVGRRWWIRALGALYPVAMLAAVLISANHWIMDAVGAAILVASSAFLLAVADRVIEKVKLLNWGRATRARASEPEDFPALPNSASRPAA